MQGRLQIPVVALEEVSRIPLAFGTGGVGPGRRVGWGGAGRGGPGCFGGEKAGMAEL